LFVAFCASVLHFGFTPSLTTVASLGSIKLLPFAASIFLQSRTSIGFFLVMFFFVVVVVVVVVENAAFFLTTSIAIEFFCSCRNILYSFKARKKAFWALFWLWWSC
jgi:predicted nucleic acid-binding Zn ribbon protein